MNPLKPFHRDILPNTLLVSINYAPEHAGIAPYATGLAEYLAKSGTEVFVLAGMPHYPSWRISPYYRRHWTVSEAKALGTPHVRRLRHYVPNSQSVLKRGLYEATFGMRVATQRLDSKPKVIIATVPSLLGAVGAARLARAYGAPLILWLQDNMSSAAVQSGMHRGPRVADVIRKTERHLFREASKVVVISHMLADLAESAGCDPEKIIVVPNWSHVGRSQVTDVAQTRASLGWNEGEYVVLHTGNIGLKQGLEALPRAAQHALGTDAALRFVVMGDGSQRDLIADAARAMPNLELLAPVSERQYPDILAAADALLVHERPGVTDMSLPSKLTSYFAAGRPVIGAVSEGGTTWQEVHRSGAGLLIPPNDAIALTDAATRLRLHPDLAADLANAGVRYATENLDAERSLAALRDALLGTQG